MIGSHNTMTYLPVRKWWMHLFNWMAKCQNHSIEDQYNKGVRVFDFRLKFYKNNPIGYFAHGLIDYTNGKSPFFIITEFLLSHQDITQIRLFAEDTNCRYYDYSRFEEVANSIKDTFQRINVIVVHSRKSWERTGDSIYTDIEDYYKFSWKRLIPFPRLYTYMYGGSYSKEEEQPNYLIYKDFI